MMFSGMAGVLGGLFVADDFVFIGVSFAVTSSGFVLALVVFFAAVFFVLAAFAVAFFAVGFFAVVFFVVFAICFSLKMLVGSE
jgi:hypothetical protein